MIDLDKIITAAEKGGVIIANYFGKTLDIEEKYDASDVRTIADTEAESAIIEELRTHFPDFSIYAEETGRAMTDSEYCFVIDPLDGSNNFVLGIPFFSVSIALMKGDEIIAGVVYQPMINKIYSAQAGQGAFVGDVRLAVGQETALSRSSVAFPYGYDTPIEHMLRVEGNARRAGTKRLLNSWSTAAELCLLAEGKIESIIVSGSDLYDVAAGKIIAREAGAVLSSLSGEPTVDTDTQFIASCNQTIHDQVLGQIIK